MDQSWRMQLDKWHETQDYPQIIQSLSDRLQEKRDYETVCQLAVVYRECGDPAKAAGLLLSVKEQGRDDARWNRCLGGIYCDQGRDGEALPLLERALELNPRDEETLALRDLCVQRMEERACARAFAYSNGLDARIATQYVLHCALHQHMNTPDRVVEDRLYLPEWEISLRPEVTQISERMASLHVWINAPEWGCELFECSVGMGESAKEALSMAVSSFLFSMMDGIQAVKKDRDPIPVETMFGDLSHRWKAYRSNLVGVGEIPYAQDLDLYWEPLQEELLKRLGNQKLCYVKIYGAKNGDTVEGECRVNDVKSEELSRRVAEIVSGWETQSFGAHKQFFLFRQEEETRRPYPFSEQEIREKTYQAVRLLHNCKTQADYDCYEERLVELTGDTDLATELFLFLPEFCAENAFEGLIYPETVTFRRRSGGREVYYKNQLAAYYPIQRALFQGFEEGAFDGYAESIYREYISISATYQVICSARERQEDLTSGGNALALTYEVGDGYRAR